MSKLLYALAQAIYDKKGTNIVAIDVRGVSSITDYLLIADGNTERHVNALSKVVVDVLHVHNEEPLHVEGRPSCSWMVVDAGEILVHIFTPDLRQKYSLEKLWHEGKIVELELNVE
ncbi:MAG: ribosome silencing factor [Waddliaceae bacterium]